MGGRPWARRGAGARLQGRLSWPPPQRCPGGGGGVSGGGCSLGRALPAELIKEPLARSAKGRRSSSSRLFLAGAAASLYSGSKEDTGCSEDGDVLPAHPPPRVSSSTTQPERQSGRTPPPLPLPSTTVLPASRIGVEEELGGGGGGDLRPSAFSPPPPPISSFSFQSREWEEQRLVHPQEKGAAFAPLPQQALAWHQPRPSLSV